MTVRALIVTALSLFALWGCSQSVAPVPSGETPLGRPDAAAAPSVLPALKYYNTPSSDAWPLYIANGPQNALWFTEAFTDKIGRVATDGTMTEFPISNGQEPEGITEGGDGNLWFTEPGANAIGRMTPAGVSTIFSIEGGSDPDPRGITLGPDGNVWYVENSDGYIGRVTPAGAITRFQVPDGSSEPWAITTGPDGDLWFTESLAGAIGRFDPRTLRFKPSLKVTYGSTPWGILLAPDRHIWFTERTADKIAEVVGSNKIREFDVRQPASYPEALTPGPDGYLWFTESQAQYLGRINPRTGKFGRAIALPSGDIPNGIATGADKNVFFTIDSYHNPSQIGEVMLR
jgi:streptogramin lyase